MRFVDTHSHLYLDDFWSPQEESASRLDRVILDAKKSGIYTILLPAIRLDSLDQMDRLISFSDQIGSDTTGNQIQFHKMAGIHPCEFKPGDLCPEEDLRRLCDQEQIIAIGETGLDGYWSREAMQEQMDSLRIHCSVARETGKPIVLHNRDTSEELLALLEEEQDGRLKGVWHCFTGTLNEGLRALDLGLFLGIGGVITFKNAGVAEVVSQLPLDRMILETDAPYLAPVPYRGKRNEPAFMLNIAQKLSDIHGLDLAEIAEITTQNAVDLFRLQR